MTDLSLGFSPCPNDTFIFHALVHGVIDTADVRFEPRLEDVETLNQLALESELAVTKVSFGALPYLKPRYTLLGSGGALGRGCGPLIVAREPLDPARLEGCRIAIPGRLTTANLLLRLFAPDAPPGIEMTYDRILGAVASGEVEAGVIIHESRFTFPSYGLVRVVDLGEWWEEATGTPIPLGAIVARSDLGEEVIRTVEGAIRRSAEYALAHPEASAEYVRRHAQEMDEHVIASHIGLYVNRYSVELGREGHAAVGALLERARAAGIIGEVTRAAAPAPGVPAPAAAASREPVG